MRIAVLGGGIFGVTAALALEERGHDVTLIEPGLPHPLAESTDISKIVRIDYGADEDYTLLGEQSLARWRSPAFPASRHYHETGVAFLSRVPLSGFEQDSYALLTRRGHSLERLDAGAIAARFPAYRPGVYIDGYYNPAGGWADASAVVSTLAASLRRVLLLPARATQLTDRGVALSDGTHIECDHTIVTAGSWVPLLVPSLAPYLRAVGQPVFHLAPSSPSLFAAHHFPVFGADISRTGYYGFPANADGIVKIANHGPGTSLPPGDEVHRVTSPAQEASLRTMLAESFPALANAPIVHRRLCVYCDTFDEHFWIARDPDRPRLTVATGGSGHAFKFAPVLGDLIASIALGERADDDPLARKFRWRTDLTSPRGTEAARHHGQTIAKSSP